MESFVPLFPGAHLQTIAAHFWTRPPAPRRFASCQRLFDTEPGVRVLVESRSPEGPASGDVILVHGLEGTGSAAYIQGTGDLLLDAGFAVHYFHMRTCGGTERYSPTLYHGGLTADLRIVIETLLAEGRGPVFLIGYSLGGNLVLKLAGELAEAAGNRIAGVCAASTPLDLEACANRLAAPENRIYERRFVKRMRARLLATGRYPAGLIAPLRRLREIDDTVTAPEFGFRDAVDYYRTQSALHYVAAIRVPTLLIQAQDDPLVPFSVFQHPAVAANPRIQLLAPLHGGHLGFLARGPRRFWCEYALAEWTRERACHVPCRV
jgi:uncharacterized protein